MTDKTKKKQYAPDVLSRGYKNTTLICTLYSIIWYRMKRTHILLRYDHISIEFFKHSYIVNYTMNYINNVSYQTSFDPPWIQCLSPGGVPWSLCGRVVHTTCPWTTSIVHNRIWPSRIWQPLHRRPAGPVKEDRMIA